MDPITTKMKSKATQDGPLAASLTPFPPPLLPRSGCSSHSGLRAGPWTCQMCSQLGAFPFPLPSGESSWSAEWDGSSPLLIGLHISLSDWNFPFWNGNFRILGTFFVCIVYYLSLELRIQFSSVCQWYPTLCNPMDCSTPGFTVITNSQSLLKLVSIE